MPRRRLLTQLDPESRFEYVAPLMRELIRQFAEEYKRSVLKDQIIKVYCNFKLL